MLQLLGVDRRVLNHSKTCIQLLVCVYLSAGQHTSEQYQAIGSTSWLIPSRSGYPSHHDTPEQWDVGWCCAEHAP